MFRSKIDVQNKSDTTTHNLKVEHAAATPFGNLGRNHSDFLKITNISRGRETL